MTINSMKKNIIIVSAGRFSREVYSWVADCIDAGQEWNLKGFLDDRKNALSDFPCSCPILDSVDAYQPEPNDLFVCAIGEPATRKLYVDKIKAKGGQFAQVIHPTVVIGKNVHVGEGCIIAPYSVLTASLEIGSFVNIGVSTICSHHNVIGDWCQISGQCGLTGGVTLGEGVFVGVGVMFVPDVQVGAWSYIGAGSVVLRKVSPLTKVFGNPAVKIGEM
jgi:sugar O-acyltransferase (sialic acid O-acetyltransferase NeuD family)